MADPHKNSFDLLRLFAVALVLYSHQHVLFGPDEPEFLGWTTFGGVGVSIFFFLSGLLVWLSWARDPNLKRFFVRRSLRISPALWFVVLLSVLVLAGASVMDAQHAPWGAWLTDRLGDLSYGMYIFALPVQHIVIELGRHWGWSFDAHLGLSFLVTGVLAYVSWHALELPALRFKPKRMALA